MEQDLVADDVPVGVTQTAIDRLWWITGTYLLETVDSEGFEEVMRDAATHYGDTKSALRRSDKLIDANVEEYHELHDSIGQEKGLRHIYSETIHVGKIRDIDGRTVYLDKDNEVVKLKTENIELLRQEELIEWKKENLPDRTLDVSVMFNSELDESILEETISNIDEYITSVETFEKYSGESLPEGYISYNLSIRVIDEPDRNEIQEEIHRVLEGLGGEIR